MTDVPSSFLQTLFPLIICGISLLVILGKVTRLCIAQRRPKGHHTLLVDVNEDRELQESEDEESEDDLTLQRTRSRVDSVYREIDKPRGETVRVAIELLALLGQLAISIIALLGAIRTDHDRHGRLTRIALTGVIVWCYVGVLVAIRLVLSAKHSYIPSLGLWHHTASLYGAQWLLEVSGFRSAIIHPQHTTRRVLTILEFTLTSLLLLLALISRRGNRAVVVEHEQEVEPSREPVASVLSLASFSWVDPIVWRGFHRTLELSDVWNVPLKDKADAVLADFRQVKKGAALTFRLLRYFGKPVLIQGAWAMLGSVFMFLPTLLLKAILEYLEDPISIPANAAWLYVILLFFTGLVQAVADGQALWIGRKICIRLRAIIVGEIYSKTLRRKVAAATKKELSIFSSESSKPSKMALLFRQKKKDQASGDEPSQAQDMSEAQVDNGTVINLMSIDSFRVADICSYLHFLWAATPVQLAMAIALLYKVLGPASFAGIVMMLLILPLNLFIAKSFQAAQKRIMAATDKRIHSTNEVLQNIRIIKYFAWEQRFITDVNDKRRVELKALWRKYILWCSAATLWSGMPILITFISFFIFTVLEKRPLLPSIAFPALSMFSLLRIPLDQLADMVAHVQESKVSIDRVEEFLREEETEKYAQMEMSRRNNLEEREIYLRNATLTWGSKRQAASGGQVNAFSLIDVDAKFLTGSLNVIVGPTGSGKTSLLMALLGEMKLICGEIQIPGGFVRQNLRSDPLTGLTESVAYCAQQPWLVNDTIKQNILFASPYDERRYKAVIAACGLERDLEILDAGDRTLVGEKGISLSGGQKQRISLARAMYSNCRHLLLDDCLSAVDSHTGKHIFYEAIMGPLMFNRTCILITHNVSLAVPHCKYVVVLDNGKVAAQGEPEKLIASGALGEELLRSQAPSRLESQAPSRASSDLEARDYHQSHSSPNQVSKSHKKDVELPNYQLETKAEGRIKTAIIKMYLSAMGPWYFWVMAAIGFIATQAGNVATNVWIRQWANAYHLSKVHTVHAVAHSMHGLPLPQHNVISGFSLLPGFQTATEAMVPLQVIPNNDVDTAYYLGVYAILGAVYIFVCFGREFILFWGSLRASWDLHDRLLNSVMRAKFRFFDITPLGQLMNRFSKDIQSVDQEVSPVAVGLFHSGASVITIVLLISIITPGFLIPGFFIACIYFATGMFYIRSSRDLKRIEAVQRSPLFQHFGETLTGVITIRAYGDESRFMTDSHKRVNTHNRPFLYLWAANRWLAFRVDFAGALVSFSSALFVVLNVQRIDAGAAGLALTYAITFTQNVLWLVRLYAANEQNMNAVERVQEYIEVEQEAKARIPETQPAADWPSRGAVEFIDYSTQYRSDLGLVLKNLTFKIQAGEKVGIVGRTGAGKSSLGLALFRGLEAVKGKILIDDVEIGLIGLQDLREAITIVPQDPTLFTGTIRSNLDPFEHYTDEEVFSALRNVQLISTLPGGSETSGSSTPVPSCPSPTPPAHDRSQRATHQSDWTHSSDATLVNDTSPVVRENRNVFRDLSSPVAESGSNLSHGQRQLLCLARALLKSPKVLIMDEATASIDYATDARVQHTLRELKNNTVITIAHRLQTIIDYDRVLVLDEGKVVEFDEPWTLLNKETGMFKSMCQITGEFDLLMQLAKKAYKQKKLVDDE